MQIHVEPSPGEVHVTVRGPVDSEEVLRILAVLRGTQKLWVLDEHRNLVAVAPEEVVWCEVVEDKVFVYTERTIFESPLGLGELESRWEQAGFFRCAKSAVINLAAIRRLKSCSGGRIEAELATGERVMISRRYAPFLRERIK